MNQRGKGSLRAALVAAVLVTSMGMLGYGMPVLAQEDQAADGLVALPVHLQ